MLLAGNVFKRCTEDDGTISNPVRTSDRLKSRPKLYGRPYLYYTLTIIRPKRRTMTAASQIEKMLHPRDRPLRTSNTNSVVTNLLRFARKTRMSVNLEDYTDSSGTNDNNLMNHKYQSQKFRSAKKHMDNSASQDELLSRQEGLHHRRERLWLCHKRRVPREQLNLESDDEQSTDVEEIGVEETKNGDNIGDCRIVRDNILVSGLLHSS